MTGGFLTPDAAGHYLAELLGTPFSAEQLAVITAPLAPQLVVAGAGSGKTTVVAARVVHAVAFHGVAPSAVLGLTFTNKAASELGERVRGALNRLAAARAVPSEPREPGDALLADDVPTVSTYHAYAAQIVADNALRIGREPQNRLLTEAARWQVAMRVARTARGPFEHLRWTTPFVAQYVLDLDSEMSEHLVGIDDVRGANARIRAQVAGSGDTTVAVREVATAASERDELLQLVSAYRDRKRLLDAVDFGDQVALAARIAEECEPVVAAERARYAVVFLDEYQDTGVSQRRMLAALFGGGHPVTAVGDPSQSIYGWRGASAGNLLRFPEHFAFPDGGRCSPQFLLTSFRNGSRILRAANALSAPLRASPPDRPVLVEVPALAAAPAADAGTVRVALHVTVEDEAEWLADQVAAELAAGRSPRDIAVLCRRRTDFDLFHRRLVARDVPVEVVGLAGLLMMPEVSDVVAVLQAIADPTANAALVRILTGPRWRIGPRDLAALGRRAAALCDTGRSHVSAADDPDGAAALADATASVDPCDVVALSDALAEIGDPAAYSAEAVARFGSLAAELSRLRRLGGHPVVDIVSRVISAIGLDVEIEASPTRVAAARSANLAAFADHAARFESVDGESDLAAFLSYLAAAETAENGLDVGAVSTADTVKLLTVHKAKGLEWDVVAVPCLSDKTFPSGQSRSRWTKAAAVLPFALRGDRDDLPADPDLTTKGIAAFKARCRDQELSEERRLAYVAVTRAKSLLIASGHRWSATRTEVSAVSPYLEELAAIAGDGGGEVAVWAIDVPEVNPLLARVTPDVQWPPVYDETALARRRDAAALVETALGSAVDDADADAWRAGLSIAEQHLVAGWAKDGDKLLEELARDTTGTRDVPLPRTLTASQVVALAASADEFAAELARPMPRRPSSAARRGTAFHAWV
ncbi:MAG: ATP-dependent helicase UvrD/PcrA, partial [Frankiaceae bacterium]|nr:ATP-dependent helicase UvrD/PcrA [Frankiaceae bacterium]